MSKREFFLRITTYILFIVGVGQLALSQIHVTAATKIFDNQIGFYLFIFMIFGLTTGFNAVLVEKPGSLVSLLVSGILSAVGGYIYLQILQADVLQQDQLTLAEVGDSVRMVSVSIVIYFVGSILVSVLSWPDVKHASQHG